MTSTMLGLLAATMLAACSDDAPKTPLDMSNESVLKKSLILIF